MADPEFVTLRSGARVRRDVYVGLCHRLSLGDRWEPDPAGGFTITFGADVAAYSMPWMNHPDAPLQVAAILDDLNSGADRPI